MHAPEALLPARREGTIAAMVHVVRKVDCRARRSRRPSSTPGQACHVVGTPVRGRPTLFVRLCQIHKGRCGMTRKPTATADCGVLCRRVLLLSS